MTGLVSTAETVNLPASTCAFAFTASDSPDEVELVDLLAAEQRQPCGEGRARRRRHDGLDGPVFARPERLDLALAVDDKTQRHRLHAPRRLRTGQLAPQHRRQGEADQIVERPPRLVGIDQCVIEFARVGHRLQHGRLGDGVEGDALRAALGHRLAALQPLQQVPRDRLALAVGVGRQDDALGALGRVGDGLELLGLVAVQFPLHREVVFWDRPSHPWPAGRGHGHSWPARCNRSRGIC